MFVGRERQLTQMGQLLESKKPTITVVYGRRRIGKTELVRQALKDKRALFFEGVEAGSQKEQLSSFMLQLKRQEPGLQTSPVPRNWREAFFALEQPLLKKPACIVLDEFQWMANYRRQIVSDLKMVWEQSLSQIPGVHLILCGSIASFMITRVIRSNALYGRTDLVVHLKGFKLPETREMLPGLGHTEILDAQMLVGGVPRYLELLVNKPSVHVAIEELAFRENGYFLGEYDRIFTSHFGRNKDYRKIIEILARRPRGMFRKEIAEQAHIEPGGGLSNLLGNLESAGFISSFVSFERGRKSRTIKFSLHDAYLRFFFAFIEPNQKKIEDGTARDIFTRIVQSGHYHDWRGRAFEYVCMDHTRKLAELLGFSGVDFSHGPYFRTPSFRGPGFQIDLLFDRADNVMTLCEMKCTRATLGVEIIDEVEKRAQILEQAFPAKTVQRVLVVHGSVTESLRQKGYFYRIIDSSELF